MIQGNSKTTPMPLFKASTAEKYILSMHRDKNENKIRALFAYNSNGKVYINGFGNLADLAIEEYQFANSAYRDDYYKLLNKIKDYNDFLATEVIDNAKMYKLAGPCIKAFNAKYDDSKKSFFQEIKIARKLRFVETLQVSMNAFSKNDYYTLESPDEPAPQEIVDVEKFIPVFETVAQFSHNSDAIYIYRLALIIYVDNVYWKRPCVNISLFKDATKADEYFKIQTEESKRFTNFSKYKELKNTIYPAIERFQRYMKIH